MKKILLLICILCVIYRASSYTNPLMGIDIKLVIDTKFLKKGFLANQTQYNNLIEAGNINQEFKFTNEFPYPCCKEINHFLENERHFRILVVKNNFAVQQTCNFQISTPETHLMNPFFFNYQNTSDLVFDIDNEASLYFHLMYNFTSYETYDGFSKLDLKVNCIDFNRKERETFNSKFTFFMGSATKYNNIYLLQVLIILFVTIFMVSDTPKGVQLLAGETIEGRIRKQQADQKKADDIQTEQEQNNPQSEQTNEEQKKDDPDSTQKSQKAPIDLDFEIEQKDSFFDQFSLTQLHPLISSLIIETWMLTTSEFLEKYVPFVTEFVISIYCVITFQAMGGGIQYYLNQDSSYYIRMTAGMVLYGAFINYRHYLLTNIIGVLFVIGLLKSSRFQFKNIKQIFNTIIVIVVIQFLSNYVERFPSSLTRVNTRLFIFRNSEPKYPTHFWSPVGIFCKAFGFYDLLIPCLYIQYCYRYPGTSIYQYTSLIGFAIALIFSSVYIYYHRSMVIFSFLLVPLMILPNLLIALVKKDFKNMWECNIEPTQALYKSLLFNSNDLFEKPNIQTDVNQDKQNN